MNELVGHSAHDLLLEDSRFSLSKGMLKAFRNAAKELLKDDDETKSTIKDRKIQSVTIIEKNKLEAGSFGEEGKEVDKNQ